MGESTGAEPVLYEVRDHIARITLNQPEQRNAMRPELLAAFQARVEQVKRDKDVRAVVIRGSGKTFCSGADFGAMGGVDTEQQFPGMAGMRESVRKIYSFFLCLLEVPVPTIAHMNGHAVGGGLGLALACDLRVCAHHVKMGVNFTKLGLSPGMATSYMLPRLVGIPRAAELIFTGRIVKGDEAARMGLVNYSVDEGELDARVDALAKEVASCAPIALRLAKRAMYAGLDYNPDRALDFEAFAQATCIQTADAQEGIMAMLQKREPDFKGT